MVGSFCLAELMSAFHGHFVKTKLLTVPLGVSLHIFSRRLSPDSRKYRHQDPFCANFYTFKLREKDRVQGT